MQKNHREAPSHNPPRGKGSQTWEDRKAASAERVRAMRERNAAVCRGALGSKSTWPV